MPGGIAAFEIVSEHGSDDIAKVYVARMGDRGRVVEFVESMQPPKTRDEKWVLIVSSLFGCPVRCAMCDAGGNYEGRLTAEQILQQTDCMVYRRYPDGSVPAKNFKVQFARMGEPALNPSVLEALELLPKRYRAPGLVACVSTVAPSASGAFFHGLLDVKERRYSGGRFQLQFSVHSTDKRERDRLMPVSKWGLTEISNFGETWFRPGDKKITLNFAPATVTTIDPKVIQSEFDPKKFIVKFTPLNPTKASASNGMHSLIEGADARHVEPLAQRLRDAGFDVIVSIGDLEENKIGSNCGMYLSSVERGGKVRG